MATPDKFNIHIAAQHRQVYCNANTYTPVEQLTTQEIQVPYYAGSFLGVQTFSLNLVTSETTVAKSRHDNAMYPNIFDWEIYKAGGFSNMDGNSTTRTGIGATISIIYGGSSSSDINYLINCKGSIRFWCQYHPVGTATQLVSLHLTTGTASNTTLMTLVSE